ncbi:MAG: hypothetical protein ACYS47_19415 [Planctomycetota bacterium]
MTSAWWEAQTALAGHVAVGFSFRPVRYVGIFVELAGTIIIPEGGAALAGADEAGMFGYVSLRAGVSILPI